MRAQPRTRLRTAKLLPSSPRTKPPAREGVNHGIEADSRRRFDLVQPLAPSVRRGARRDEARARLQTIVCTCARSSLRFVVMTTCVTNESFLENESDANHAMSVDSIERDLIEKSTSR